MSDDIAHEPEPPSEYESVAKLQRAQPDVYRLETVDVARLHALLKDDDRLRAIGDSIIRALITDVLRSKLGFDDPVTRAHWVRVETWSREWTRVVVMEAPSTTTKVIQNILAEVSLSEDELRIVRDLNLRLNE